MFGLNKEGRVLFVKAAFFAKWFISQKLLVSQVLVVGRRLTPRPISQVALQQLVTRLTSNNYFVSSISFISLSQQHIVHIVHPAIPAHQHLLSSNNTLVSDDTPGHIDPFLTTKVSRLPHRRTLETFPFPNNHFSTNLCQTNLRYEKHLTLALDRATAVRTVH